MASTAGGAEPGLFPIYIFITERGIFHSFAFGLMTYFPAESACLGADALTNKLNQYVKWFGSIRENKYEAVHCSTAAPLTTT